MFLLCLSSINSNIIFAEDFEDFKVKIITECKLYKSPNINLEDNLLLDESLLFGEELIVVGEEILGEDSIFVFYPIIYLKEDIEYQGYVIKNFVIKETNVYLNRKLDSNARIIKKTLVFVNKNEEEKLLIKGTEVFLQKDQEIRVIDNSDKIYKKVMFSLDGNIYTGFIKGEDVVIEGFNSTIIIIIFVFFLAISIAVSIFFTTRKKRKKNKK